MRDGDRGIAVKGFIAQEVEQIAPFAVKTTTAPIPSILRTPAFVSSDHRKLTFGPMPLDTIPTPGSFIRLMIDNEEHAAEVYESTPTSITFVTPLPVADSIFVYGEIVNDFKLLDSERLVPMVYGAIKELHTTVNSILDRLKKLEEREK
jgi:hypothetical protein